MPIVTCEGCSVCDADVSRMVWNKKKGRRRRRRRRRSAVLGCIAFKFSWKRVEIWSFFWKILWKKEEGKELWFLFA
jgi:hypothetical protein